MRLKICRKMLRQISLMTLTACSTLLMILLIMEQIKMNICNNFEKFLTRYEKKGLKFNLEKCEFGKASVNYMGHILSSEGLFPEPEKVDSILNMEPPSNKSEVCSFLGLATYCGQFIPNF